MTLGDIGRPTIDQFAGLRRLLLVPFVSAVHEDEELSALVERYWEEAARQVRNLEERLGGLGQMYLEGAVVGGESEVEALKRASPAAAPFVRDAIGRGATLRKTEDADTLLEAIDLQRCLMVAQGSPTVANRLFEWLADARKRRYATIARRIDETLPAEGVAVLVISQDHQVQFASDIRVFYVAPPVLDQIHRWVRAHVGIGPVTEDTAQAAGGEPPDG